jgi:hypothetical protein
MYNSTKINKCSFCSYFVGGECTAAKSNGQINEYYCHQAIYEYSQWLKQQKAKNSKLYKRY